MFVCETTTTTTTRDPFFEAIKTFFSAIHPSIFVPQFSNNRYILISPSTCLPYHFLIRLLGVDSQSVVC